MYIYIHVYGYYMITYMQYVGLITQLLIFECGILFSVFLITCVNYVLFCVCTHAVVSRLKET